MSEDSKLKFNFSEMLETSYCSTAGDWDELYVDADGKGTIIFYISDRGEIVVELIAHDNNTGKYKNVHIQLSELKDIVAEVEQMASVTFDGEGEQKNEEK